MSAFLNHIGWAVVLVWMIAGPFASATWGYNRGREDALREARRFRDV